MNVQLIATGFGFVARPSNALGRELKDKIAQAVENPWLHVRHDGSQVITQAASLRMEIVRESDSAKLKAIIRWQDTQPTVRKLARARLKLLTKRRDF